VEISSEDYVKQAVTDVEPGFLRKVHKCLPTRVAMPLSQSYRPEIDGSAELDAKRGQNCQSLIGVLRWVCELGRIDIMAVVAMLLRYVV
jgi:hypothetical protein